LRLVVVCRFVVQTTFAHDAGLAPNAPGLDDWLPAVVGHDGQISAARTQIDSNRGLQRPPGVLLRYRRYAADQDRGPMPLEAAVASPAAITRRHHAATPLSGCRAGHDKTSARHMACRLANAAKSGVDRTPRHALGRAHGPRRCHTAEARKTQGVRPSRRLVSCSKLRFRPERAGGARSMSWGSPRVVRRVASSTNSSAT